MPANSKIVLSGAVLVLVIEVLGVTCTRSARLRARLRARARKSGLAGQGLGKRRGYCAAVCAFLACGLQASSAAAQGSPSSLPFATAPLAIEGPYDSTIVLEISDRLRGEFVDWFAPVSTAPAANSRYDFLGNKLQLGARATRGPYEVFVQYQDSTLAEIPDDGVGVGATYFANTHRSLQHGAILRQAWAGAKEPFGIRGLRLQAGRMLYNDALDVPAANATLKWIQYNRLSQRLIGPFDYTHIGRSFDGGLVAYEAESINLTGFGFVPTYGGYEVDANRELDITIGGLALNLKESPAVGAMNGCLFWYYYGDSRDVLYVDNRPLPERQAKQGKSSRIHTIGAHLVRAETIGPGTVDGMAYGFGQFGEYQNLTQLAWAYGAELGYRLDAVWSRPWLRGGINSGAGDTDTDDDTHGTFFQLLPTAWMYAQFPFYNMMNNQDVFAQAIVDPHPMVSVRLDWHWLRLNSARDLVYSGGGATQDDLFGYGAINGNGRMNLAQLIHLMLTLRPTAFLTVNAFYAHAWGQGAIDQAFDDRGGNYGFIETRVGF